MKKGLAVLEDSLLILWEGLLAIAELVVLCSLYCCDWHGISCYVT